MEAKKITIDDLFYKLKSDEKDFKYNTLLNYFYGKSAPSVERRRDIADALGVTPLEIVEV